MNTSRGSVSESNRMFQLFMVVNELVTLAVLDPMSCLA